MPHFRAVLARGAGDEEGSLDARIRVHSEDEDVLDVDAAVVRVGKLRGACEMVAPICRVVWEG